MEHAQLICVSDWQGRLLEPSMSAPSILSHFHFSAWREPVVFLPTLRCDHCRNELGLDVHRYWRMRFCSRVCVTAYQQRLAEITRIKTRNLDLSAKSRIQ